jgi:Cytochrome c554 and c-prime
VCAIALAGFAAEASAFGATAAQHVASPAPVITCGTCHAGVVNSYAHAAMRHAMEPAGADPALLAHPNLSIQQNGYTYTVATKDGKSTYTVSDGTGSLALPLQWMLGQHSQTWVLEKDGRFYESLVSYFARDQVLATTPGDEKIVPRTLPEAMGRELSVWEVRNCFNCHASGFNPEEKPDPQKLTPGLDCERCHGGAAQHMTDAVNDNFHTVPKPLTRMDSAETANFCGQCHRTWERVVREGWHGTATVRFQPYRLENSKCFDSADKRISCLACHDPHQPVKNEEAYYDAKCQVCHSAVVKPASTSASGVKSCPVAKDKCVSCHMPKVYLAGGHAVFTDHQIRIVHPGDPYPN